MKRTEVIQKIINAGNFSRYLEIGTLEGSSFFPIRCKNKVAVDPVFLIPLKVKLKWIYADFQNINNKYFEMTSDDFFMNKKEFLQNKAIPDVVFIDGLHTFEGSLKDVLSSLKYINKEGVIIMHDCYPPHSAAATPASSYDEAINLDIEGWTNEWCGDVWKTIAYLKEKFSNELEISVLDTDYGLGIIRCKENSIQNFEIDRSLFNKINKLKYETLQKEPEYLINLKDENFLNVITKEIKNS